MLNLSMSDKLNTRVIQVTNIAPSCSKDQLRTLFGYLGRIKELEMFPPDGAEGVVTARVGYIEFEDSVTTGVALHLSSTVFIDRAIMIVPVMDGKIPDESSALNLTPSAVAGMLPGQPTWPANVVSQVTGLGANQIIMTNDPRLTSLGLPQYPPLPATTDPSKIEEIRRTVYLSDLDPKVTPEMLLSFFSQTGEIKYIRLAGDENGPTRSAYIEFTDQRCIAQALSYNNVVFQGRTVSVKHATTSIVKPTPRSEASQREIDDAMKKVKEASKLISAAANSDRDGSISPSRKRSKSKGRSRSHSKSRRSRSRSRGRRRRSISKPRRRSRSRRRSPKRSRSPVRRRRSRSRGRVPPPAPPVTRDRRRSRTRSPVRRRRSRSRSKSRGRVPPPAPPVTRKSRTPPKSYSRGRRSRSRSRRSRSRDRKEKVKERKKSRSMSPPTLIREESANAGDERDVSPVKGIEKSPSPPKARKRSMTPKKRSRSKSPSRRKKRRHSRSTSRKRSRSRSGSRHRSRKDRKQSRSRDRKHDSSKKKSSRDKDDKKKEGSSSSSKIKRDYDEEEKGFASEGSDDRDNNSEGGGSGGDSPTEQPPVLEKDTDHQTVDMDMSD